MPTVPPGGTLLLASIAEAASGIGSVAVLSRVHLEDHFPLDDEPRLVTFRNAPALLPPGPQLVLFSARRTVSAEICITTRRYISSSANNCFVQRVRPADAALQQMATSWASAWPFNIG
jgi:hypothetical protein